MEEKEVIIIYPVSEECPYGICLRESSEEIKKSEKYLKALELCKLAESPTTGQ